MKYQHPMPLHEMHIMLITANTTDRLSTRAHLASWGIEPTICQNSVRAFSELIAAQERKQPYQVVFVETGHIELEASQLATSLRAEPCLQTLYLVGISPTLTSQRSKQLLNTGYSKLIHTPLNKTRLFNTLHFADQSVAGSDSITRLADHYETTPAQQPLDILLACNSPTDSHRLQRQLEQLNHHSFTVTDGTQALDALDNHHFDLAIVHNDLVSVSGIEVVKIYRFTHLNQPWVPFILLFDNPSTEMIKECEDSEINEYLATPQQAKSLEKAITNAMQSIIEKSTDSEGFTPQKNNHQEADIRLTLDLEKLSELVRLNNKENFLHKLIQRFSSENLLLLEEMETNYKCREISTIRNYGHQLKDNAGNLGALSLYRLGVKLTKLQQDDLPDEFQHLLSEIKLSHYHTVDVLLQQLGTDRSQQNELL